jgi:hypothetical protein
VDRRVKTVAAEVIGHLIPGSHRHDGFPKVAEAALKTKGNAGNQTQQNIHRPQL